MSGTISGWRWAASLPGLLAGLLLLVPLVSSGNELSQANRLLFEGDHLRNLGGAATLLYELKSSKAEGKSFTDRIEVHFKANPQGDTYKANISYLTGDRRRCIPSVPKATGNPILKVFLQRQVLQMQEVTGGNWRYFQKSIKQALAQRAQVEAVTFPYRGKRVKGTRVHIAPYRNDKYSARMGKYAAAEYDLLLSEAVPGRFYRMEAKIPSPSKSRQDKEAPLLAETLTFKKAVQTKRGD